MTKAEQTQLIKQLSEALEDAHEHLEYCGYGDNYERECADDSKLDEKILAALKAAGVDGY